MSKTTQNKLINEYTFLKNRYHLTMVSRRLARVHCNCEPVLLRTLLSPWLSLVVPVPMPSIFGSLPVAIRHSRSFIPVGKSGNVGWHTSFNPKYLPISYLVCWRNVLHRHRNINTAGEQELELELSLFVFILEGA